MGQLKVLIAVIVVALVICSGAAFYDAHCIRRHLCGGGTSQQR
jgi:hypothetical protein